MNRPAKVFPWIAAAVALASPPTPSGAQTPPTGWEVAALPALSYDSDEGFGYGALAELYDYGDGTWTPYRLALKPTLFFTTEGRRDVTLFVDALDLLPGGWRLTGFLGREKHIATPYYGPGNASVYDPERVTDADPYYYRFGRTRTTARVTLRKGLGRADLYVVAGAGVSRTSIVEVPKEEGTTLLRESLGPGAQARDGWSNGLRLGLVRDTRDREIGPTGGSWTEILLQGVPQWLGSDWELFRWTLADRRYFSLSESVVFAHRVILQGIAGGDPPFHELFVVQGSFTTEEGLGGAKSVRGILKNRFTGRGMFIWNGEVRWHAGELHVLGRPIGVVLSAFTDAGRVWNRDLEISKLVRDLHVGFGGGVRFQKGGSFVVALDAGHSSEAGTPIYIGLGYLY